MKVRVLLVTQAHKPIIGGSTEVYDQLGRHSKRIEFSILCPRRSTDTFEWIQGIDEFDKQSGYEILRLDEFRTADSGHSFGRVKRWCRDLGLAWRAFLFLRRLIQQKNLSVLVVGNLNSLSLISWLATRGTRTNLVHYLHGEELTT